MTTMHPTDRRPELIRAATVTASIAAAAATLVLAVAGWVAYDTATYVPAPHEDTSLLGVGFVVAAVIGVPAAVSGMLAVAALVVGRRRRGGWALGLAVTALVVLLPVACLVTAFLGLGWLDA